MRWLIGCEDMIPTWSPKENAAPELFAAASAIEKILGHWADYCDEYHDLYVPYKPDVSNII